MSPQIESTSAENFDSHEQSGTDTSVGFGEATGGGQWARETSEGKPSREGESGREAESSREGEWSLEGRWRSVIRTSEQIGSSTRDLILLTRS